MTEPSINSRTTGSRAGASTPVFVGLAEYLDTIQKLSKPLEAGLPQLLRTSQTILIGCHEPQAARDTDLFLDAVCRLLPELKKAGLNYIGVWANASQQAEINRITPAELRSHPKRCDPISEIRSALECSPPSEVLIRMAKQIGLEVLLLKPPGFNGRDFNPQEFKSRVAFMAQRINAQAAQGHKGIVFTLSADLPSVDYQLPGDGPLAPLAAVLAQTAPAKTIRVIYPGDRSDDFVTRLAPYLKEKLPAGVQLLENEFPISASGGKCPEKCLASQAMFCVGD
jgi:hypothetical protein